MCWKLFPESWHDDRDFVSGLAGLCSPGDRRLGYGGVKTCQTLEGGGFAPKVAPQKLGLLAPKLAIFYSISVERDQFQGPLKIQNFQGL